MQKAVFGFIVFLLASCMYQHDASDGYDKVLKVASGRNIKDFQWSIDTLKVNNVLETSAQGFWKIRNDSLYYFDPVLAVVDVYNLRGEFIRRGLGIGRGPGEVMEEIGMVCKYGDGWLLAEVYNIYHFSREFGDKEMKFLFHVDDNIQIKKEELRLNPDPENDVELYVPAYDFPQMLHIKSGKVLIKVSCEYPDYKEMQYYMKSAIVAEYDFTKGTITKLMGRYPPCYSARMMSPAFSNHYFTPYKNEQYLLSFGLDSLIYICDENFVPQKAFGLNGKFVNNEYRKVNMLDKQFESYDMIKERNTKGYFTSIYYCKENDLILRVYKTGVNTKNYEDDYLYCDNSSRMQIYKGTDLIGDVPVPQRFEIIDYQSPYFYANGYVKIGEESDQLGIYKFKLEL